MTEITEDIIERMSKAIPDLYRDYHDQYSVFVTVSGQSECGRAIRIAVCNRRNVTKPPVGVLEWVRKTPSFRLDNPHCDGHGTLFVDIVPN